MERFEVEVELASDSFLQSCPAYFASAVDIVDSVLGEQPELLISILANGTSHVFEKLHKVMAEHSRRTGFKSYEVVGMRSVRYGDKLKIVFEVVAREQENDNVDDRKVIKVF